METYKNPETKKTRKHFLHPTNLRRHKFGNDEPQLRGGATWTWPIPAPDDVLEWTKANVTFPSGLQQLSVGVCFSQSLEHKPATL